MRLSEIEAAYMAGFFDGEGSVNYYGGSLRVSIAQKDTRVLYWMESIFGGGVSTGTSGCHYWWVNGAGSHAFLAEVMPYLRIKEEQVLAALARVPAPTNARIDDLDQLNDRIQRYLKAYDKVMELQALGGMSGYAIWKSIREEFGVKDMSTVERWLSGAKPRGWKKEVVS